MPGNIINERFEKTKALFHHYFDELGISVPEKPIVQTSRYENQVQAILDIRPPIFSFSFGIPSADILEQCRKKSIVTAGAATTLDEALALEAAGVDLIIASGFEAGGHRPSFLAPAESSLVGSFVLVQQIKDRVHIPVIAAGGIANGKGIAAALALGADGVQIGTAFLACEESAAPPFHRDLLFSGAAKYTVLSRAFTGRLGRGLVNQITAEMNDREKDFLPFPSQSRFTGSFREAAINRKKWELIFVWGGQIASVLKHRKADDLMNALIVETNAYYDQSSKPFENLNLSWFNFHHYKNTIMNNTKVWYITGASRGLGLSLVKKLLSEGYRVAATSRSAGEMQKAVGSNDSSFSSTGS
jgi:nitronate monooxygenase